MKVSDNNILGWTCEPGKNIPKATDRALECRRLYSTPNSQEFILTGFDRI